VRASAIALLVAALLLGGCAEKHEASTALPTTSAAETTESLPTVGPADFPVPDEARTKDAAGAEAFLRYFIDLLNRQQAIPNGGPIRALGPECDECLRIAKVFDSAASAGQHYEGGKLTLNDVATPQLSETAAEIAFGVRVEAVSLKDAAGEPVVDGQAKELSDASSGIGLVWSDKDKTWLVDGLTIG